MGMESASATVDFTQAAGFTFVTYSAEHFATLVRAWAEHPGPISKEGALDLCGQCGWTITSGEEELLSIPVPNGNNNGTIRTDFISPGIISGIDIELTPRPPTGLIPRTIPVVHRVYNDYLSAISSLYGRPTTSSNEVGQSGSWTLPNHISLILILNQTYIKMRIHSPAQTERNMQAIRRIVDHGCD